MTRNLKYKRQRSNMDVVDVYPDSIVDQCCLTIKQQIDRFKMTGEIPHAGDYQYVDDADNRTPIDNYMSDPVDISEKVEIVNGIVNEVNEKNRLAMETAKQESANNSTSVEDKSTEKAE